MPISQSLSHKSQVHMLVSVLAKNTVFQLVICCDLTSDSEAIHVEKSVPG